MNWKKGFFRLWIALSIPWIAFNLWTLIATNTQPEEYWMFAIVIFIPITILGGILWALSGFVTDRTKGDKN